MIAQAEQAKTQLTEQLEKVDKFLEAAREL